MAPIRSGRANNRLPLRNSPIYNSPTPVSGSGRSSSPRSKTSGHYSADNESGHSTSQSPHNRPGPYTRLSRSHRHNYHSTSSQSVIDKENHSPDAQSSDGNGASSQGSRNVGNANSQSSSPPPPPKKDRACRPEPLQPHDLASIRGLGEGSFGKVMLTRVTRKTDNPMERPGTLFATKCIPKSVVRAHDKHDPEEKHYELTALSTLPWNPFVAGLINVMDDEENLYLNLELIPCGHLYGHISKRGPFDTKAARFYAANIICALDFVHSHGFVHRDVKGENILMAEDGYLCLSDFSLAKSEEDQAHWQGIGPLLYRAPELIEPQGRYTRAVDWWAVGCLIYEMLAKRHVFYAKNDAGGRKLMARILKGRYKWPTGLEIDPDAKDLVGRLLEQKVEKRIGTRGAEEVMEHPWFKDINWRRMKRRMYRAPFIPPRPNPSNRDR